MIEREAIYPLITYVGNAVEYDKPVPYLSPKAGGNNDTFQKYKNRELRYREFVKLKDDWFGESRTIAQYIPKRNWGKVGYLRESKRKALRFFLRADEWIDIFLKDVYGSVENAFWNTKNKEELIVSYINWFEERKEKLRMNMTEMVSKNTSTSIAKRTGKPLSHGGVADLLKVLTKTMEKQGSDITSIAKMQYAICKQAGIIIVDEFIEDVAVIEIEVEERI